MTDRAPALLHACWAPPDPPPAPGDAVLSFLSPAAEARLTLPEDVALLPARRLFPEVQAEARELYCDMTAAAGAADLGSGATLRRYLTPQDQASRWWFHPVPAKNCEYDPTFLHILSILALIEAGKRTGAATLALHGAPAEISDTLASAGGRPAPDDRLPRLGLVLRSLAHRLAKAWYELQNVQACHAQAPSSPVRTDVALAGYWDWSVAPDPDGRSFRDRYFGRLPEELAALGLSPVWFFWLDPRPKPGRPFAPARKLAASLRGRDRAVALQAFLTPRDILSRMTDLRPLLTYLRARNAPEFRAAFRRRGLDFLPLFRDRLLAGFLDWSLPQAELTEMAAGRAVSAHRPKALVTFLEHFLHSRALYAGARAANPRLPLFATQHASYNSNKTFLHLDPRREFRGEPDGCPTPRPDAVFAMGSLGRDLFSRCGYASGEVILTGGPRYDEALARPWPEPEPVRPGRLRVLLVCTLDTVLEMDMVEAAAMAAEGLSGVSLALRSHPARPMPDQPGFAAFRDRVTPTSGSLEEDMAGADLVLFVFSTVAEEAAVRGRPVWQWLPRGYDGSALAEVAAVPRFGDVAELRRALTEALADPQRLRRDLPDPDLVLRRLFHTNDGQAARRVAKAMAERLPPSQGAENA